jgi:hypothetical protein
MPPSSCCQGRYAPLSRWPAASLDSGVLRGSLRASHFSFRKMGDFQCEFRAKSVPRDRLFEMLVRSITLLISIKYFKRQCSLSLPIFVLGWIREFLQQLLQNWALLP